jgi:acetyl esterase/lipase
VFDWHARRRLLAAGGDLRTSAIAGEMVEMMIGSLGKQARCAAARPARLAAGGRLRLPPTHVVVGGEDPLAVQAEALVKALAAAGVPHEHWVDEGMPHGYAQMEFLPPARPAIERMVAFLRKHL